MQAVSVFMMDVTNSTKFSSPKELDAYLAKIVQFVSEWTDGIVECKVKNRYGDEILLVSEHFFTGYTVAYFLKQIWRYDNHPPVFGATYGMIENTIADVGDIDTWNDPIFKRARSAIDRLKQAKRNKQWIEFEDPDYSDQPLIREMNAIILDYQNTIFDLQTPSQRLASAIHLVSQTQQDVAVVLNKSQANVSKLLSKARVEVLKRTFESIVAYQMFQEFLRTHEDIERFEETFRSLLASIQSNIQTRVHDVFGLR